MRQVTVVMAVRTVSVMGMVVVAVGMMSSVVISDDADNGNGNGGGDGSVVVMTEIVGAALTVGSCGWR